ncbi:MAG: cytochrome c nitrite reductase small subunit [Anaerolineales bacterium]|jgi:cytochrome c nitrite reductase small subunit
MKLPFYVGIVALVAVLGVGMYVTEFTTYLGNNPTTCNNCHIMDAAYEGWYHAGHKSWTTCSECHTPHAFIPKYYVKAISGYHHVTAFSFGNIPDAIRAKESSRQVVQDNCVRCHQETVSEIMAGPQEMDRYCFDCHRTAAHGSRGVSILPYQHQEEYQK